MAPKPCIACIYRHFILLTYIFVIKFKVLGVDAYSRLRAYSSEKLFVNSISRVGAYSKGSRMGAYSKGNRVGAYSKGSLIEALVWSLLQQFTMSFSAISISI